MLLVILGILQWYKKRRKFAGELFIIYIILYAIGRSIIELYRGDEARGFIIPNILSHSQFIALIFIALAVTAYVLLYKRKKRSIKNSEPLEQKD
jgi:phosphatidylglycerol---prolipoprotein diacylglyceryl transferase